MAGNSPKDLFSRQAESYARYRPSYPERLFEYVASLPRERRLAWDCATGNGQAAAGLAPYFDAVLATDMSARQIELARRHPGITYQIAPAERSPLADASADLVTAATAAHWFDLEKFYAEVRRVAKPGGAIALWCYSNQRSIVSPIGEIVRRLEEEIVGPYWEPETHYVIEHYKTLPFPFKEVEAPALRMSVSWNLSRLLGYLSSWSATQKYLRARGENPLDLIEPEMKAAWGDPRRLVRIGWDLHIRAGRV